MARMLCTSRTVSYALCVCNDCRPHGAGKNKALKRIMKKTVRRKENKMWRKDIG